MVWLQLTRGMKKVIDFLSVVEIQITPCVEKSIYLDAHYRYARFVIPL